MAAVRAPVTPAVTSLHSITRVISPVPALRPLLCIPFISCRTSGHAEWCQIDFRRWSNHKLLTEMHALTCWRSGFRGLAWRIVTGKVSWGDQSHRIWRLPLRTYFQAALYHYQSHFSCPCSQTVLRFLHLLSNVRTHRVMSNWLSKII